MRKLWTAASSCHSPAATLEAAHAEAGRRTKRGRAYRQRGAAVEPVFGQTKERQGALLPRNRPGQARRDGFTRLSDECAEQLADAGRDGHGQCAPERHPGDGAHDIRTACFRSDGAQQGEEAQGRDGNDRNKCAGGRHDDHEQWHGRADGKRRGGREGGLYRTRGGDLGDAELVARMGRQRVLRHQLLGNLPRQRRFHAALHINLRELVEFELGVLVQFFALPCELRVLVV